MLTERLMVQAHPRTNKFIGRLINLSILVSFFLKIKKKADTALLIIPINFFESWWRKCQFDKPFLVDLILFDSSLTIIKKKLTFPSHFPEPHSSLDASCGVKTKKTAKISPRSMSPAETKRIIPSILADS